MKTNLTKRLATLGMISICAVGVLTGCATSSTPSTDTSKPTSQAQTSPEQETAQATSPMGDRPIFNYNEDRYVLLNNGEAFELTEEQIGEKIADAHDGVLFELKGYNKEFRMAFQYNDMYYIAQNVANADDSAIDVAKYLETANLKEHVVFVDIFDHMGVNILNSLSQEEAIKLLDTFAKGTVTKLSAEEFEAIGKAQVDGDSFMLEFMLEDNTTFTSYIIPSMNYITIGDYTCVVEDLEATVGSYFENLEVSEDIIYN